MKIIGQSVVEQSSRVAGTFNRGEHTFLQLEPGKYQTISVQLPKGQFVTFAFVPGSDTPDDFECCDIHSTIGPRVPRKDVDNQEQYGFLHHFIGFTVGHDTFSTRKCNEPTTLATLLLREAHYNNPQTEAQRLALVKKA